MHCLRNLVKIQMKVGLPRVWTKRAYMGSPVLVFAQRPAGSCLFSTREGVHLPSERVSQSHVVEPIKKATNC